MKTNLSKVHLHLLLALEALLSECHVTRAGEKLFLSQSAMSNLLKQLREIFQDPLLVRGAASSMTLTPRAESLKAPVKEALAIAAAVFAPSAAFDPKTLQRKFVLGMSDYAEYLLLPHMLRAILKAAPQVDLVIQHVNFITDQQVIAMEKDQLDVAVGIYANLPALLMTETLFTDKSVCVGWKKNPLLKKPLTLKSYAEASHLMILFAREVNELFSEQFLLKHGYKRRAVVTVPHTLAAIHALPGTPLLATVLERIAKTLSLNSELGFQPLPYKYATPTTYQVWHPKNNQDPAHQWLREIIRTAAQVVVNT